jgi:hypothetical protein
MSLTLLGAGRGGGGGGVGAPSGVTFDGVSSGVTLSNGNLTVTGLGGDAAGGRSLSFKPTGKFYFEDVLNSSGPNSTNNCGIGIAQAVATYEDFIGLGNLDKTAGLYSSSSQVWAGGNFQDSFGGLWTAGTVGCCAVDIGANKLWFRKNNGAWSLSGNPASGTGAITIQSASWAPIIAMQFARTDSLTGRFLAASWAFSAPSGFGEWTP